MVFRVISLISQLNRQPCEVSICEINQQLCEVSIYVYLYFSCMLILKLHVCNSVNIFSAFELMDTFLILTASFMDSFSYIDHLLFPFLEPISSIDHHVVVFPCFISRTLGLLFFQNRTPINDYVSKESDGCCQDLRHLIVGYLKPQFW